MILINLIFFAGIGNLSHFIWFCEEVKLRTSGGYQRRVGQVKTGSDTSSWWGPRDVLLFFKWRGYGILWLPEFKDAPD